MGQNDVEYSSSEQRVLTRINHYLNYPYQRDKPPVTANGLNLPVSMRRNPAPLFVVSIIVVAFILGTAFHAQIKNQLNAWKLLPQPERLTELYFTQPNNLPTTYTPGQSQTVHFTVHNIEYRAETYPYKIVETSKDASKTQPLASGRFTLLQDQYQAMNIGVTPVDLGANAKIIIELPTVNEQIDYWAQRSDQ